MGFPKELFLIQDGIDEFTCAICLEIIRGPSELPECQHKFCITCITKWFSTQLSNIRPNSPDPNPTCPTCRNQINTRVVIKDGGPVKQLCMNLPNPEFGVKLLNLQMRCEFAPCGIISRYVDYEKHKMEIHKEELARKRLEHGRNTDRNIAGPVVTYRFIDADGNNTDSFELSQ